MTITTSLSLRLWAAAATVLAASVVLAPAVRSEDQSKTDKACPTAGAWLEPASGRQLAHSQVIAEAAEKAVVLLGETHDNAEHHRWQLSVLAGLRARRGALIVGFESFPRRVQPVLDSWVQGGQSAEAFLEEAEWPEVWAFDPGLYMPLFDFVRMHRLPMIALNVERKLVSKVGQEGWDAVPAEEREGLSDPAPASEAYRRSLAEVYRQHSRARTEHSEGEEKPEEPSLEETMVEPAFGRFVAAQLTWDRAMAEALATAHRRTGNPTVVGIIGSGHLRHRHGVPHQLADLGIEDVTVFLPVDSESACESQEAGVADALFVVEERSEPQAPRPRLGVLIETVDAQVLIRQVSEGSVAATAELLAGDVVSEAAGVPLDSHAQLIEIVQRQAPGTWLPLTVERDGETRQIVAKFPKAFE